MTLTSLALQNFRSYKKQTCSFSPHTSVILGPNGSGKTNILEAIMLLATGRSFRAGVEKEIIRWETDVSRITCLVSRDEDTVKLETIITSGEVGGQKAPTKRFLVNGVPRRMVDFIGNCRVVLFWPEDLELVTGSPSLRRRYLDSVLVQTDREYRRNLMSYERALRQRNKLLDLISEGKSHRHQLLFWNQLLIRTGGYITQKRAEYLAFVNETTLEEHRYLCVYDKSVISESRLEQYRDEEVAAKSTLVGPHRDDFTVHYEERDLSKFGSRGEQRLAVLWLKLAELSYIERETRDRPLLLLDDILSELDKAHRAIVFSIIDKQQTILTSADPDIIHTVGKGNVQRILL